MNKRRRYKAKRRRVTMFWRRMWAECRGYAERRRALLWLRENDGLVWP